MNKRYHLNDNRLRPALVLIAFGVVLGVLAAGVFILDHHNKLPSPASAGGPLSAPSSIKPKPQEIADYSVPADSPKYLAIPAISISKARVIRLGLLKDDQIAEPSNIYDTGWYEGSSKPGQLGAMFIYGHVSSWTANGLFYNLKKLKTGDKILVTRGDNQVLTYQVVTTKVYPYNDVDMAKVLAPIDSKLPGLNLMTCTGKIIKGTSEFNERLVVFTSLAI